MMLKCPKTLNIKSINKLEFWIAVGGHKRKWPKNEIFE